MENLNTSPATAPVYAGFWIRALASCGDLLAVLVILCPILGSLHLALYANTGYSADDAPDFRWLVDNLAQISAWTLFSGVCWTRWRATPGKMSVDLQVVDARTGEAMTWSQALLRNLGYVVSAAPFGLGYLWAMWDPRHQAFHDKIAGTVVIQQRVARVAQFSPRQNSQG